MKNLLQLTLAIAAALSFTAVVAAEPAGKPLAPPKPKASNNSEKSDTGKPASGPAAQSAKAPAQTTASARRKASPAAPAAPAPIM